MDLPVITLQASSYENLSLHHIVLNPSQGLPQVYLRFDSRISDSYTPSSVYEITEAKSDPITFSYSPGRHWIDILFENLNVDPGYHKYRIDFTSKLLSDVPTLALYFSYTIQTESPPKPYIYMNRSDSDA